MKLEQADSGWGASEFEGLELGDRRLERRLKLLAEQLSAKPQSPIHHATEDWKSAKAAYRFFDNEKVSCEKILAPHQRRTLCRFGDEEIILAIQDTTFITFNHRRSARGLGPIGDSVSNAQGLIMHTTFAVTPALLPLGILNQKLWARGEYQQQTEKERRHTPIEEKESYRWLEALRQTKNIMPQTTRVITICDREADIYEFLQEAQLQSAEVVVRAAVDRRLREKEEGCLWGFVESKPVAGFVELALPRPDKERPKQITLEIRFATVTLKPTERPGKRGLQPLTLYAVLAREQQNVPSKKDPLEWMLLSNVPITSFEDAVERLSWYRARWQIEVFHKILKSGCEVERCLLETAERLKHYLTLFSVIAWRIFWMTHISRIAPNAPAEMVITKLEHDTLKAYTIRSNVFRRELTTVREVLLAVAMMGGFLNRKNDPKPGPLVLWRGWQRLQDMTVIYESPIGRRHLNGSTYG